MSVPDLIALPREKDEYQNDVEFAAILREVELAFEADIYPQLIKRGSSGSYFIRDRESVSVLIGVCCVVSWSVGQFGRRGQE